MNLTIRTRHVHLTPVLHEQIRHRLYTAFGRISPWIRAVDVTISDINGPKGGLDKQCRLRVRGRSIPGIVIEHVGVDTLAVIADVAERAEQAVLRSVRRQRSLCRAFAI